MLQTIDEAPTPYPIITEVDIPEVVDLVRRSHEQQWDPTDDISWESLRDIDLPADVKAAGALFWSLRAWMEHGALPYGAERFRQAIFEHRPVEVKQHLINFIREEARHFEASYRVADLLGGFQSAPMEDYFEAVIPKFHDEKEERELSFYANLFLNTLFEAVSGDLLADRYRNATNPTIKEVCKLILRDEGRHIRFGKLLMKHKVGDLDETERRTIERMFEVKLRQSLLRGVYAVTNLPDDLQAAASHARTLAAEWGLGATSAEREPQIIAASLRDLRAELAPLDIHVPYFPEVGDRS